VQYVAVPEFADMATKCTQELSAAIAGRSTTQAALAKCQALAETAAGENK
jgi:sorbitol/mannitol transport system substrate-binding protein